MRLDPAEVAILVAGIHHQEITTVRYGVDEDIIDDATLLVAEQRVLNPAGVEAAEVAADDALGEILVPDAKFSHVGKVEQPDGLPYRTVLLTDAAVLKGHDPTTEVGHLGAEADVFGVERCPLGGHDQTLRLLVVKIVQVVNDVEIVEELLVVRHSRLTEHSENDLDPGFLPLQQ